MKTRNNGFSITREQKGAAQRQNIKPGRSTPSTKELEQEIRREAYFKYLNRGGKGGSDRNDWLEAEREIKRRYQIA